MGNISRATGLPPSSTAQGRSGCNAEDVAGAGARSNQPIETLLSSTSVGPAHQVQLNSQAKLCNLQAKRTDLQAKVFNLEAKRTAYF